MRAAVVAKQPEYQQAQDMTPGKKSKCERTQNIKKSPDANLRQSISLTLRKQQTLSHRAARTRELNLSHRVAQKREISPLTPAMRKGTQERWPPT